MVTAEDNNKKDKQQRKKGGGGGGGRGGQQKKTASLYLLASRLALNVTLCGAVEPRSCQVRQTIWGAKKRLFNNRKYGANKLGLPDATEFLQQLTALWAQALKKVRQPWPRQTV